jgi:hypothetical protein
LKFGKVLCADAFKGIYEFPPITPGI